MLLLLSINSVGGIVYNTARFWTGRFGLSSALNQRSCRSCAMAGRLGSVSVRANLHSRLMLACGMVSPLASGGLDAVCGVRLIGDFGATRAHDAGLPPGPLPHLR
jgi:hypothetical protein